MKYNDEAFNISSQFYSNIQDVKNDDIDKDCQNELLQILLKRFSKELEENKEQNNGIIKAKFKSIFWGPADEGYDLIQKLIKSKEFDSFASQYCFYLSDVYYAHNESDSYFEIIWDYKTYFESLSVNQINIKTEGNDSSKQTFAEAMTDFNQLPLKYQVEILKFFASKVDECKKSFLHEEALITFQNEGHIFGKWKHKTWTTYSDTVIDHQIIRDFPIEHEDWERVCTRCGFLESMDVEPQELVDERREKKKRAKIKRLERELKKLKEED